MMSFPFIANFIVITVHKEILPALFGDGEGFNEQVCFAEGGLYRDPSPFLAKVGGVRGNDHFVGPQVRLGSSSYI